ncbi:phytoene dehydrogenase [Croceicoccus estronivorus]|uniref:phytoene desaturase n=1 Tax=Croceicoccus estronivorus TaxID=1172626 RepID=UPI00082C88EE|nr:phytoene desaturase [Croceicoccus estronivorus]OCC23684.1 phytoene dehydrogenase [Croceicoccus estronivorus]
MNPGQGKYHGKHACVIGAGFGGLALAIRLQAAGVATTIVEARDKPGGCAYFWQKDGFTFDAGPTVLTAPACLEELWELTDHDMADDVELMRVSPFYRLNWPDGTNFDYSDDQAALHRQIARLAPADLPGFEEFQHYSTQLYREGYQRLGSAAFPSFASMVKAAPGLARYQVWRSVYSMAGKFVQSEKLREALSFQSLLTGGNPMTASAVYALVHKLEQETGIWWPRGGTNRLVAAMARQFERLGGTIRLHDPVVKVETLGNRATGVRTQSGWHERFDAVASNADIIHSYRDLLGDAPRGKAHARSLARKRFSPGLFAVHFGIEGTWPGIPHHTVLFGPRYKGLLDDIYDYGVLPRDFAIYLHHPTVTDPSVAPPGKSTFCALVPVAHMGKLTVDWEQIAPVLEKRVLDEVGRRLIPDIHDRVVTSFHYSPRDFALDLNAHLGSAFSLEPILTQSAWFRAHNRDDTIGNFYLVGAGTHPGAGIPAVAGSAKATAALMLEDFTQ